MKKNSTLAKWWSSTPGFIAKNVLLALFVLLIILVGLFYWLRGYTNHGVEVEVPQISGLTLEEAKVLLQAQDLSLQVIDSTFSTQVPLGTIVDQLPPAESMSKPGRVVYVVLNARQRQQVVLPDVWDVSYRQAQNSLQRLKLVVDSIRYEPSTYRDLVLNVEANGVGVMPGTRLTEGAHVVLVVGKGLGESEVSVPSLLGLNAADARSLLLHSRLTLGSIEYDEAPTEENKESYVVFQQVPAAGTSLREGMNVNIRMSKSMEKAVMTESSSDEEEFF